MIASAAIAGLPLVLLTGAEGADDAAPGSGSEVKSAPVEVAALQPRPRPRPRPRPGATTESSPAAEAAVEDAGEGMADETGGEPPPPDFAETPAPGGPLDEPAPLEELEPLGHAGAGEAEHAGTTEQPRAVGNDFLPLPDRWRIGIPGDYVQNTRGQVLDPYNQNVLKGDYPIMGEDKFLILTLTSDTLIEARRLPVPASVAANEGGTFDFFSEGEQQLVNQNFIASVEFFEGDTAYRPRDFELRATVVGNVNYTHAEENQVVAPDFSEENDRVDEELAVQELFYEKHLGDISTSYDFYAIRLGIQGFTSDFRGFLFSDNEPGVRLFGTYDNNRLQWNLAFFRQLEKDTNSGLNTFNDRDQNVFIANVYRQDFLFPGYTAQLSFHANIDDSSEDLEFDKNGFLVRPQPLGTIDSKEVKAYYLGWAGDGHIGRVNITHQFYQVLGNESFNPIADQEVDINAQFFATELSYDQDYVRYRASFAWSSGDDDPFDDEGGGFDTIFDNPNFAGGGFSFFTRQGVRLTGSGVGLTQRNSFVPNLRTSKEQGQANFVNPGLFLYNVGMDVEVTPKVKLIGNISYLQFDDTQVLEEILQDNKIGKDIGIDYSLGVQYRPYLNNNVIFTGGAAALVPGQGFKDLYTSETLYSFFVGATFTY